MSEVHDDASGASGSRTTGPVRVAAAAVAVVLVGLVLVLATRDTEGGLRADSPLLGELVPRIEGETFAGEAFDIDDERGRWIAVNFFASWCVPCEVEHPELIAWSASHTDDGLIVSVPFGDTEADARAFFDRLGGDWPVVFDDRAQFAVEFGVLQPPETFLVAPDGTVVGRWQGAITAAALDRAIEQLTSASEASS